MSLRFHNAFTHLYMISISWRPLNYFITVWLFMYNSGDFYLCLLFICTRMLPLYQNIWSKWINWTNLTIDFFLCLSRDPNEYIIRRGKSSFNSTGWTWIFAWWYMVIVFRNESTHRLSINYSIFHNILMHGCYSNIVILERLWDYFLLWESILMQMIT